MTQYRPATKEEITNSEHLRRRERIATAVLSGWLSGCATTVPAEATAAHIACLYADALIAELDKVP